jgi:DNA-binding transcriptional LysR family regulator
MYHGSSTFTPSAFVPIESHRLHVFHAVAANGSIAEAARQLCLTRSALSHALRTLEHELGCDLFTRSERKLALTEAGLRLLPHAQTILEQMEVARLSVSRAG